MAEVYLIDGEALDPSSFGETNATTGKWIPKKYTGDYNYAEKLNLKGTTNNEALDVVVNRVVDKCWIKSDGNWVGGGDPSDTSSAPTFHILNGEAAANLYWATTAYDTAHTVTIGTSSETGTQPQWADSSGSWSTTTTVASGTFSSSYGHARTGAMTDGNVYAFTYTIDAPTGSSSGANHSGWFITDSVISSYASTVPDEQSSINSVGSRWYAAMDDGGYAMDHIAVYGDFVALNTTGSDSSYSGFLGGLGTNSFYLKFDGTDLGEDSSGIGNDWTASGLTASQLATVSAATGGLPIYNTSGDFGGTKESGYRTDSSAGTTDGTGLVLAIPGDTTTDVHASINTGSSTKTLSTSGTVSTSTATSKFYGTSIDMTSTTAADHWTVAASSDFAFGTGSFTIEWWQYWNDATSYQSIFDVGYLDAGALLIQSRSGYAQHWVYLDEDVRMQESTAATLQEWTHYALVKNGNTLTLYRNGVVSAPTYTTTNSVGLSDHDFHIGADESDYYIRGYIQDFRVYKGVAKYTSAFSVVNPESTETDVLIDSPTSFDDGGNGTGNYATWNPLDKGSALVLSEGNLKIASAPNDFVRATIGMTSGKWYYEETVGAGDHMMGLADGNADNDWYLGQAHTYGHNAWGWYKGNGGLFTDNDHGTLHASYASMGTYTTGDVIGVAFDADNGALYFSKNGTWNLSATKAQMAAGTTTNAVVTGLTQGPYFFAAGLDANPANHTANFGQRAWAYPDSVPDGFKALNTYNLSDPTIVDPSKQFDTVAWTATSTNPRTITTPGEWDPGLVWHKMRSADGSHYLWDKVRTFGDNAVKSNSGAAEGDASAYYTMADATNGFSIQQDGVGNEVNYDGNTYVSWMWNAGDTDVNVSAGGLNDDVYDASVDWSGNNNASTGPVTTSDSSYHYTYDAESLFTSDPTVDGNVYNNTHSGWIKWEPDSTYTFSSTVEIRCTSAPSQTATITTVVDGSDVTADTTITSANTWVTIASGGGVLKSIKLQAPSGEWNYWNGIRIDGKELVDSASPNVPSSASTYRANTDAGFSIVTYTGTGANATVAHGLNAVPHFMMIKNRDDVAHWVVYHHSLGTGEHALWLNEPDADQTSFDYWDGDPTSTLFKLGYETHSSGTNLNTKDYVAYCWSEVEGYSRFGQYLGTGDTDGAFVYCGFRPRWIMIKHSSGAYNWNIHDTERNPENDGNTAKLYPNTIDDELDDTEGQLDILSNGFKLKGNWNLNNVAATYVFAAFAEEPFKYANAR